MVGELLSVLSLVLDLDQRANLLRKPDPMRWVSAPLFWVLSQLDNFRENKERPQMGTDRLQLNDLLELARQFVSLLGEGSKGSLLLVGVGREI